VIGPTVASGTWRNDARERQLSTVSNSKAVIPLSAMSAHSASRPGALGITMPAALLARADEVIE
jgi:hypothetical protein